MTDFDQFVAGHAGTLLRTAYLICGDLHESEDLVQETLLKISTRWSQVRRMEHPLAYTRRVLVNLATDGARTRRRAHDALTTDGEAEGSIRSSHLAGCDETDAIDTHHALVSALAALPPRQRAVLVLRYFLDLPEAEVALILECSLGTVKSTASRGLARLAEVMRPNEPRRSITT